jgi:hypothetical protein
MNCARYSANKRILSIICLLSSLFLVINQSFAQVIFNQPGTPQCPALLDGKPGIALSEEDATQISQKMKECQEKVSLLERKSDLLSDSLKIANTQIAFLEKANNEYKLEASKLREASKPSWLSNGLWVVVGMAIGAAVTIGIVYALRPAHPGQVSSGLRF